MLLGADSKPIPPQDIVRRLQQIDPKLDLVFGHYPTPNGPVAWWSVAYRWESTDPRHRLVAKGDLAPDACYDILLNLPLDCSPDEAYGYVVNNLKRRTEDRDVKRLLERVHAYNDKRREEVMGEAMEVADEEFDKRRDTLWEPFGKTTTTVRLGRGKSQVER